MLSFGAESFSSSLLSKNLKIKIYRNIVLLVYGCETWSLTLKEKCRLRMFENRALRRIFGPKRDEVTGKQRKLHNEELNDLYCSPNIFRVIKSRRMSGACSTYGENRVVYRVRWENLRERDNLEDPGIDGRIILRWVFKKWDVGHGMNQADA